MTQAETSDRSDKKYLNTSQAAKRMGLYKRTVRDLCENGLLAGAYQKWDNGPWQIPESTVIKWIIQNVEEQTGPPARWLRFKNLPWIFYPVVVFGILTAVIGLLSGIIATTSGLGEFKQDLIEAGIIRAFPRARMGETLIAIMEFNYSEGLVNTNAHGEIRKAIADSAKDLGLSNLRVEIVPIRVMSLDESRARNIAERYGASIIIWGEDSGVRVAVNFFNIAEPRYRASKVSISEEKRTQLADPSAYSSFITQDLPGQLTFLSLFAVGQAFYNNKEYVESASIFDRAIESVSSDRQLLDGLGTAYFFQGYIYQTQLGNSKRAIELYNKSITLDPDYAAAYNNRGNIRYYQGELEAAISDHSKAIELEPNYAAAYNNRGAAHHDLGELEAAITDYNRAIDLEPNNAAGYNNRGAAHYYRGELEAAIADYSRAIEIEPNDATAYNNRGAAHQTLGDMEAAIADYTRAVELDPNGAAAYNNRGVAQQALGKLEAAIVDYSRAIELEPNDAAAYYNRGKIRYTRGELEPAIADFSRSVEIDHNIVDAYQGRAIAYYDLGDLEGSVEDFTLVIALDPYYADAYWGRGSAYRELENIEAALSDFRKYLELRPDADNREIFEQWIEELEGSN